MSAPRNLSNRRHHPAERLDSRLVAALVPCHREPPKGRLIEGLLGHVREVLLVADGMPEPGACELERLAGRSGVSLVRLPRNAGKGYAIAAGLECLLSREPAPRAVIVVDADGQHPPSSIPDFLEASPDAELVIGDRFGDLGSMPWQRRRANLIASRLLSLTTRHPVRDSQCGMRLLRGRALLDVPFPCGGYEAETMHLKRCLKSGVPVAWVRIPALYDGQPSSFRPIRDSARVLVGLLS